MPESSLYGYIQSLKAMSPMPDDEAMLQDSDRIDACVELVEAIGREMDNPCDSDGLRALIYSFGLGDGFEAYWATVHAIERCRSELTLALIRQAASDGAPGVRKWCCLMLGRRRDTDDLTYLLDRLGDTEPLVVTEALWAIRVIARGRKIPTAVEPVQGLLDSHRPGVANAARQTLDTLLA